MELCTQIMCLPTYIIDIHYDNKVFNEHTKTLHHQVGHCQEDVSESLLTSLFAVYVPNQEFQHIICQKWHEYDMKAGVITPDILMAKAMHKYNALNHGQQYV